MAEKLRGILERQARERMEAAGGDHGNQHTGGKLALMEIFPEPPEPLTRDTLGASIGVSGK